MKTDTPSFSREFVYATIGMDDYVRRFRDAERISDYCLKCTNYGHHWGCPPFDYSVEDKLHQYKQVLIVAARIYPSEKKLPIESGARCLLPVRMELEQIVRELERERNGQAMGLAGLCTYCGTQTSNQQVNLPCSRLQGLPCRHPELVRPSLEAWGFDVSKTAEELLDIPILWSTDGLSPEYFTLVCGVFHNENEDTVGAVLCRRK